MKKTNYTRIAATYDQSESRHHIPKDQYIDRLLQKKNRLKVLDLGCGTGNYLSLQQKLFNTESISWYGLDPSDKMLAIAKSKVKNVQFTLGKAERLPFKDKFFDYVICNHSYHHFLDKKQAFSEIYRVLKTGGLFFINSIYPFRMINSWVYCFFQNSYEEDCQRFLKQKALSDLLRTAGFRSEVGYDKRTNVIPTKIILEEALKRNYSQLDIIDEEHYALGIIMIRKFLSEGYMEMESEICKMYLLSEK